MVAQTEFRPQLPQQEPADATPSQQAPQPDPSFAKLQRDTALTMLREGNTYDEVQRETGLDTHEIAQLKRDNNIPMKSRHYMNSEQRRRVDIMLLQGAKSQREIAALLGVTLNNVSSRSRALQENGAWVPNRLNGYARPQAKAIPLKRDAAQPTGKQMPFKDLVELVLRRMGPQGISEMTLRDDGTALIKRAAEEKWSF